MEPRDSTTRFPFGRNWRRFTHRYLDDEAVASAARSLAALLERSDLSGLSFLDIGCGSGLSSLAAYRLGATRILSFDPDDEAVSCCRYLREREDGPSNWEVRQGSILDPDFVDALGHFDIVYAWGVLHHTGVLWDALARAAGLVGDGGILAIAIYNKAEAYGLYPDGRIGPSRLWPRLKRSYGRLPARLQSGIDLAVLGLFVVTEAARFRNPRASLREYRKARGMDLRVDIRDWLGGYPYEFASVDEVFRFLRSRGYELVNLVCHGGLRCNEYVFERRRQGARVPTVEGSE